MGWFDIFKPSARSNELDDLRAEVEMFDDSYTVIESDVDDVVGVIARGRNVPGIVVVVKDNDNKLFVAYSKATASAFADEASMLAYRGPRGMEFYKLHTALAALEAGKTSRKRR